MWVFDFDRLRQLRKQRKMHQKDGGAQLGCTASSISKIELGETAVTAEDLARLANIYGDKNLADFFVQKV